MKLQLAALVLLCSLSSFAYETDQYSNRLDSVPDSLQVMDQKVNRAVAKIASQWRGNADNRAFARAIYYELGGWYWADKIERWAAKSDQVHKYPQTRHRSIYSGMPIWATRVTFLFGIGASFRVNDVMLGSDKFGHFFSQGFKYYKRHLKGWDAARVYARGAYAERWIFGQLTTGNYANADLVANYEGYLFYRSLFEDNIIEGKGPILEWRDNQPIQIRQFSWRDHINDYWDEALNPSYLTGALQKRLYSRIAEKCLEYKTAPDRFIARSDTTLWQRYELIGLKDNRQNQFQRVCEMTR